MFPQQPKENKYFEQSISPTEDRQQEKEGLCWSQRRLTVQLYQGGF